jgi:hypothetical protein
VVLQPHLFFLELTDIQTVDRIPSYKVNKSHYYDPHLDINDLALNILFKPGLMENLLRGKIFIIKNQYINFFSDDSDSLTIHRNNMQAAKWSHGRPIYPPIHAKFPIRYHYNLPIEIMIERKIPGNRHGFWLCIHRKIS